MVIYSPKPLWEFSVRARITSTLRIDSHDSLTFRGYFSQYTGVLSTIEYKGVRLTEKGVSIEEK